MRLDDLLAVAFGQDAFTACAERLVEQDVAMRVR
jgi:hypothetical protein